MVGPAEEGERVDVVVTRHSGVTRARVQRALKAGEVTVAGVVVRPSYRLEQGDVIEGPVAMAEEATPIPEQIPVDVLYSDDRLLVVSKPPGMVAHPDSSHSGGTLVNALLGLGVPLSARDSRRPGIVHRLDKDTSGALLVAKDDDAHRSLVAALRARSVERTYLALVRGAPPAASGTVDAPVGRHPAKRRVMAVVPEGRAAVTHYRVLASYEAAALLEVRLETGRTHQIRVHLSHLGNPVLGDRLYGGANELARSIGLTRPFLHAVRLRFPHPDDGRAVEVEDPLAPDLVAALTRAGAE
ncbi:MAG: RluA family pseudouridine synthase [Actinomycetota bacterium]|nr:RluA family pseudouridine synthase [Actinomycetota bacterium]